LAVWQINRRTKIAYGICWYLAPTKILNMLSGVKCNKDFVLKLGDENMMNPSFPKGEGERRYNTLRAKNSDSS